MPIIRTDRNQTFDPDGNLIAEEIVEVVDYPSEAESLKLAARLAVADQLEAMPIEQVEALSGIFPDWESGVAVTAGDVYRHAGVVYKVVQGHTTQADWTPDVVSALFTAYRAPASVSPWVQPTGAQDAYRLGEQVTHKGQTWANTGSDANVWEPGVFGWTVA